MTYFKSKIVKLLVEYFGDDDRRITHALEVWRHAETISLEYDHYDHDILVAVSLLHDIGIKLSEEELGYNNGKTQEEYGPDVAEALLAEIDFPGYKIVKVKEIIGNHHSPSKYDYPELEILKKADDIVNSYDI